MGACPLLRAHGVWIRSRLEIDAAHQLGVERDDDRRDAHQHRGYRRWHGDAGPVQGTGGDRDGEDVVAGGPREVLN